MIFMKRINQDINDNNFSKVYLLYGDEAYLRNQYRDKLISALVNDGDTMNYSSYSGKDLPIGDIIDIAETMPFLAERRVILIEDSSLFGAKGGSDELSDYIKQIPESTCMIFSEENVDKRSKLFKAVNSVGYASLFETPTPEVLSKWVQSILRAENKQITRQALDDLLENSGNDMMMIKSELDKLIAYTLYKDGITSSDIEAICIPQIENKIFNMLDYMMAHRTGAALSVYSDLLKLREAPAKILSAIEYQLRLTLHVKGLLSEGKSPAEMTSILGAKLYPVTKAVGQAKQFKTSALKKALDLCSQTEEDFKSGKINDQIGVELLIISISNNRP